ncbi:MAG: hypothetical protein NTV40_10505 [Solirubrobacterales bacterium]|nr:hypothetical protein [Solirubrobacterales bacterium]
MADGEAVLIGAAPNGEPGEAWAYRRLPLDVGPPVFGGTPLSFGQIADPASPDPQLAFLRYTDATGWQVTQTPTDLAGNPYRGFIPNPISARMTPNGGGVLVGRDPHRTSTQQAVALYRNPRGRWRELPAPPDTVALPASGPDPAEVLADERGAGRVSVAAYDQGQRLGLYFGLVGGGAQAAVAHWDGEAWTREPIEIPVGSEGDFEILAMAASTPTNAWMLVRPSASLNRGVVLYQRVIQNGMPKWTERSLGAQRFSDVATPSLGVSAVTALTGAADSLTVTNDGLWIDGKFTIAGAEQDFTLYFDPGTDAGRVTGSWCDAGGSICEYPFAAKLTSQRGYRSFAWGGDGFGTRVITNALSSGAADDTNRGTYFSLEGSSFRRKPGAGGNYRRSGAFTSADDGWLEGPVRINSSFEEGRLRTWPVSLRAPLTDVASEPGKASGELSSSALAVGSDGAVVRYSADRGWSREFLLSSAGAVARPLLRAVAWPEAGRAYAVGDLGAMWVWRAETRLWERDPATPVGLEANLMGVAFDPKDPNRGYAVGKDGTLLRYGKSWEQETLPAGFESANLTKISFAGSQAIVAAGGALLVNDGGAWHVDEGVKALLDTVRSGDPQLFAVSGLPDGGAVAGGRNIVIVRDSASGPWRFTNQPLPGSTVIAAAAWRDSSTVRAVVSVVAQTTYPSPDIIAPTDPNVPPPLVPPYALPGDGYVLRESASGWRDEQHTAFSGSSSDRPLKSDPILAFDLGSDGNGWAVGGWSGEADSAGRGSSSRSAAGKAARARVQTAGIYRYEAAGAPASPGGASASAVTLNGGVVSLAIGGHAECADACADLRTQGLGPDRTLATTLAKVAQLSTQAAGPRLFLYTGGRVSPSAGGLDGAEARRYAELLGLQPTLPVFAAVSAGDSVGASADSYISAFEGFAAPFGRGELPAAITTQGIPGAGSAAGGRTHYAFDSVGPAGTVRVIVIDNSRGSLAASDPYQNPSEAQAPWLTSVLADAKASSITTVVVGSKNLNPRTQPALNVASDGNEIAKLLVDGGASAYFFERPEENRTIRIPAGSKTTIPAFGTGTLGYRSSIENPSASQNQPDALFGDNGFLLADIDVSKRNAETNRAPVAVRLIPVIDDLALQAVDGVLLRRSRVALFQGIGRRPIAGDRWGPVTGDGTPNPPGGDPYITLPPAVCLAAGCSTRVTPEYRFSSSDTDIGEFVKVDPESTSPRKPLLGGDDKPIADSSSGLFCAYNAGTTTVTVASGGLAYSQQVTVQAGSVQRPCGTTPLAPSRFPVVAPVPASAPPPAPAPAPTQAPPPTLVPPPLPIPTPAPVVQPLPAAVLAAPLAAAALIPPIPAQPFSPPSTPPPTAAGAARPIPPGGAVARVFQVEEKREEEVAPESTQAFSTYRPQDHSGPSAPLYLALIVLAAGAGAAIRIGPRGRGRSRTVARPAGIDTTYQYPTRPNPNARRRP